MLDDETSELQRLSISAVLGVLESKLNVLDRNDMTLSESESLENKMEKILRNFRAFRNSQVPVNSIPDEILAIIFEFVCETEYIFTSTEAADTLASVCRRWRSVATSDTLLWSEIYLGTRSSMESASRWLFLSKAAPISIIVDSAVPFETRQDQWIDLFRMASTRIRKFEMHVVSPGLSRIMSEVTLPSLVNLVINCGHDDLPPRLTNFFGDRFPQLGRLLLFYFISWPSGIFSGLTSLKLYDKSPVEQMSSTTFLDLLDASPLLETLHIRNHGPANDGLSRNRVATLRYLLDLQLSQCEFQIILRHLRVSSSTLVTIENPLTLSVIGQWEVAALLTNFCQMIPDDLVGLGLMERESPQLFDLCIGDWNSLSLSIRRIDSPQGGLEISEYISCSIRTDDVEFLNSVLLSLSRGRTSPTTREVSIKFDHPVLTDFTTITVRRWREALRKFPNLQRLVLYECLTTQVFAALCQADDILFPSLRFFELRLHATNMSTVDAVSCLKLLKKLARHRNQCGFPIRELRIDLWCQENEIQYSLPSNVEERMCALRKVGVDKLELIQGDQVVVRFGHG